MLNRSEHLIATGMTPASVDGFLSALAAGARAVEVHYRWRPQTRDSDDDMVLEAAINGQADALVTHNPRDFGNAGPRFGVEILRPNEAMKGFRL